MDFSTQRIARVSNSLVLEVASICISNFYTITRRLSENQKPQTLKDLISKNNHGKPE
ncbi:MAG: hypothetical protein Q8P57_02170 [Candidatus Pacearchaeota archaeon]|nr:hypothetical protein [Candidatus Pacearchaeota archaeon]